jgi:SNF2 family DNA or RNA helicase
LFAARAGRCLLADDMGLGKTVQALAAVEVLAREGGVERVLIVAPTSLKHQWRQEIEKFTSRSASVVQGLLAARAAEYARPSFYKITNYDVVHRDLPAIRQWAPDLVILDEAQRIKNWKTLTARSVKQLPSEYAIVLTGTPLENRLEELHSIVEFVDRFRLGPLFRFLHEHQHVDDHGRVVGYRELGSITRTLSPVLLRRTKDEVLSELPERLEKRLFMPMTDEQWLHHEENKEIVGRIVRKWKRFGFLSEKDQLRLMCALQNMRMSCDSAYLLDQLTDRGPKPDEALTLLSEVLESDQAKVVVFSQWLAMHALLEARLRRKRWGYVLFHGGVPGPQRRQLVERFREDPDCRLFLATDAGGVGLNLQHANVVFNMDLPWNPAVLEQRIGRVHRLGQRQPVRVYHFISENTIEHGMLSVLAFKKSLFAGVLDGGAEEVFLGGTRLKRFMESVENATGAIPGGNGGAQPAQPAQVQAAEPAQAPAAQPATTTVPAAVAQPSGSAAGSPALGEARQQQAWAAIFSSLHTLLGGFAAALQPTPPGPQQPPGPARPFSVERDEKTGQSYLKLPLQAPERLEALAQALRLLSGAP